MTEMAFSVRGEASETLEIDVYDTVGEDWGDGSRTSAKRVRSVLRDAKQAQSIVVRINSTGGDVFDGLAIHNGLRTNDAKVTVHIDGLAASIASVIAMAGDEIIMADSAFMMIHNPWGFALGDADDMRAQANLLDKVRDTLADVYVARTGQSREDVIAALDAETWMTADEAKALGYATKVVPLKKSKKKAAAAWNLARFTKVPPLLAALCPVVAKAVPYSPHKPVDTGSWDGAAAEKRLRAWAGGDDIDWAKYRKGFAWYDENNAEAYGSYKLPHHDVQGGAIVTSRAGVIAAGNALSGSRGGVDIPESEVAAVKAHLAKHYAQFDLTPPWESKSDEGSPTVANGPHGAKEGTMFGHVLIKLGLPADASEADAVEAIDKLQLELTAAKAEVSKFVATSGTKTAGEAHGTFAAWRESVDELATTRAELARLEENAGRAEAKRLVDEAQGARKIVPATRGKAEAIYIKHGLDALKAHLDALVPIAPALEVREAKIESNDVATAAGAVTHDGKRYEQMTPGERADLRSSGELGERIYQELRTDWLRRNKPRGSTKAA